MEYIAIIIIAVGVFAGQMIANKSKTIDSPTEQAIEHILRQHGLDVDFSADKKKQLAKEAKEKASKNQQNKTNDKK